jgi:hypothetical protein
LVPELIFQVGDTVLGFFGIGINTPEVFIPVIEVFGGVGSKGVCAVWQERGKRSGSHYISVQSEELRSVTVGVQYTGGRGCSLQAGQALSTRRSSRSYIQDLLSR